MTIKRRIKIVLRDLACRTFLAPKSFGKVPSGVKVIDCQWEQITPLLNTSNNVFRIRLDKTSLFFRTCKVHKEIHAYVKDELDFYYTYLRPDVAEDRMFVEKALSKKRNFRRFIHMGMTNDEFSGAYRFCMGQGGEYIGLAGAAPAQEERLKDLVQYIWGELFVYTLNGGVKKGHYQTYNASRSIASRRTAERLGLGHLIPQTEYALLRIDGRLTLFGTVMEQAPGVCMEKESVERRKEVCSPALQKSLNELNLLDVLCLEKDHRVGNYHVVIRDGAAVSVVAFDNDSPASFGIGGISFATYMGCSPWACACGTYGNKKRMNRPYIDKNLANTVIGIDGRSLHETVKDLLNPFQIRAMRYRLKKIQKVLALAGPDRCLGEEQWDADTLNEELSGAYGVTYLSQFLQEQKLAFQPWIKSP